MFIPKQRSDLSMLEVVVALMGLGTCALLLMAFWGLDLLGMRRRKG